MNILMLTNTYLPHVGGVARSVDTLATYYRARGHQVLLVAPEFPGRDPNEEDVIRIPAIQNFNGSDFSVRLPIPAFLFPRLNEFRPDIVHSHHPFLLGDTALRIAARWNVPIVFTHHTMYERYTHYVPGNSRAMQEFAIRLVTGYANLCDYVIAPSESIRQILVARGVDSPISVIPTGVDYGRLARGDGERFREKFNLPQRAFVIGHVGRLAPEKNLKFLAKAVAEFIRKRAGAHFLVVGQGPSSAEIERVFKRAQLADRLCFTGSLSGEELSDAYRAMDVFAFSSLTETQGVVVAEAMAARLPVIALDAPGVREVVKDFANGRLLKRKESGTFVRALWWYDSLDREKKAALAVEAEATGKGLSADLCAEKALRLYDEILKTTRRPITVEGSVWESTLRLVETEFELLRNQAQAAYLVSFFRELTVARVIRRFRRLMRRIFSRKEWSIRLLRLKAVKGSEVKPGLVLLQIDGLSRRQFETAIQNRKMPFLRWLLNREGYLLETMYSGLPSTTPAVQGELFYGKKGIVPAFGFLNRENAVGMKMIYRDSVKIIEEKLKQSGEGLLKNGSCYSDIYRGGASEVHFSPGAFGLDDILASVNPLSLIGLGVAYGFSVIRAIALTVVEVDLALLDCIFGALSGQDLLKELKFISSRVAICILLRELCTIGASIDVTRGLEIVHANFLGYDEQSHRRGPGSRFAHWTLKGIDQAIERIWFAAKRSSRRSYQVWVYSDHGQAGAVHYQALTGQTVEQAVEEAFGTGERERMGAKGYRDSVEIERARWLGGGWLQWLFPGPGNETVRHDPEKEVEVFAMGPLGHVYCKNALTAEQKRSYAETLVKTYYVPLVLYAQDEQTVIARTRDGELQLPREGERLCDKTVDYSSELIADLVALCQHPDAGDLVISGYTKNWDKTITFPVENGSHGGPTTEETRGMLVIPRSYRRFIGGVKYVRPIKLRELAEQYLGRKPLAEEMLVKGPAYGSTPAVVRVMSYNVHSCFGMDGRSSPARIAEVIARYEPDLVCLQELDVGRSRTGAEDQALEIARQLEMDFHFHPAVRVEEEQYGDAILSRYPIELCQAGGLPSVSARIALEPRGALRAAVDFNGIRLQLVNTHFGLLRQERKVQADEMLSERWLGGSECGRLTIFCGDLNATPGSKVYQMLTRELLDVQVMLEGARPKKTWSSRYPVRRIDYIFVTPDLRPKRVNVPRTALTRMASDHLPLIADIEI